MKSSKRIVAASVVALLAAAVAYAGCGACGPAKAADAPACCVKAKEAGVACAKCAAKQEAPAACCAKAKATGEACAKCAPVTDNPATVSTDALKVLLDAGTPVTVLDARGGKLDDGVRIPGAKQLIPGSSEEAVAAAVKDKKQLVVTYCASLKCGASRKLAGQLKSLGYGNVLEYSEGIAGWIKAGNKTVKITP